MSVPSKGSGLDTVIPGPAGAGVAAGPLPAAVLRPAAVPPLADAAPSA